SVVIPTHAQKDMVGRGHAWLKGDNIRDHVTRVEGWMWKNKLLTAAIVALAWLMVDSWMARVTVILLALSLGPVYA
nr:matrix protein M [Powassan virus]